MPPKNSNIPEISLILEAGVIVDPFDEALIASNDHQEALAGAIVTTLDKFNKRTELK